MAYQNFVIKIDRRQTRSHDPETDSFAVTGLKIGGAAGVEINSTSLVTADNTKTFTNKTFDVDGAGNSLSNIANANIKAAAGIVESKLTLDYSTSGLNTAVGAAQGDATQALADAATADGKAVAAQSDATTALANAATADGKAVAAQSDATTALANAATADGKAVAAQSDIDGHVDGTANKHDASEIDIEGAAYNYVTQDTDLESGIGELDSQIKTNADAIGAAVDDTVYGAGWDGVTTVAPSKNAVYDKIETLGAAVVSDVAYGSSTWDGVTTVAASKNAIRDKIVAMDSSIGTAQGDATQALADAATADGKAVAAQSDATQALADAATADGKAVAAQSDATTALANAATADGKAVAAQATADAALPKAGGTMVGDIVMGANKITSSAAIVSDTQYTTKSYVDALTAGGFVWINPLYYVDLVADDYGSGTHIKDYVTPGNTTVDIEHSDMVIADDAATYRATGSGGTTNVSAVAGDVMRFLSDAENGFANPTWENLGHISNTTLFPANSRWGVSTDTDVTPSGTFAGKRGSIFTLTNGAAGGYNASWALATELSSAGTGVSESVEMTFPAASTFTTGASAEGDYFLFESDSAEYVPWFNVTDGSNVAPTVYPSYEKTLVQIDVLAADTADQVAAKAQAVLTALTGVTATGATNPVTVTVDASAAVKNAVDVNCGVTFANLTEGNYANGPQDKMSFTVNNADSKNFGKQFTFTKSSGRWVNVGATASIVDGVGLKFTGNVLDVNLGAGIKQLPTDEIGIDVATDGGLELSSELTGGQLQSKLDGSTLSKSASGLKVNEINNAQIGASAAIALSKLESITAGYIPVGPSGDGAPVAVQMTGDVTISDTGVTTIGATKVTNGMLAGSIVDTKLNTITTSNKVSGSAVQLAANGGLEDSTGLQISTGGISEDMLAGIRTYTASGWTNGDGGQAVKGNVGFVDTDGLVKAAGAGTTDIYKKRLVVCVDATIDNASAGNWISLPTKKVGSASGEAGLVIGEEVYLSSTLGEIDQTIGDITAGHAIMLMGYAIAAADWEFIRPEYLGDA